MTRWKILQQVSSEMYVDWSNVCSYLTSSVHLSIHVMISLGLKSSMQRLAPEKRHVGLIIPIYVLRGHSTHARKRGSKNKMVFKFLDDNS